MKNEKDCRAAVRDFCLQNRLLCPGQPLRLAAAVSGGADSMALLLLLRALQPEFGYTLSACHVNHGLRGAAADRDEAFVRQACGALGVPLRVFHAAELADTVDAPPPHAGEDWARRLRYACFERLCEEGIDAVATAHTANDQAETLLLRLARGTGLHGAGGIRPRRPGYCRPLLGLTRAETEALCAAFGQGWVTDETNESDAYARNRLRHGAVPALRSVNAAAEENLARFCEKAAQADAYFAQKAEALLMDARLSDTDPVCWRLEPLGKFKVYQAQSTVFIEPKEDGLDMDEAFRRVSHVFGIVKLSRAVECPKDFAAICETAEAYLGETLRGIRTFKVEARRSDKSYPMTSPELMRELGAYLLGKHNYLKVDVHNPQFKVIVEIRDYGAYIHGPKVPGEGGLPVGTSGRALNMLSGGIDSPVAAYRMAKRGLALDHIHFASPPYTSERAKLKVKALAQLTSIYTGSSNLFVVPYTKPQEYIRDNAPDVLFTVLMRRSMMRIANVIAKRQGCEALVTGESLAQVASQTVKALQCTDAAQDLPILRPLIGMDKTEIVETARHINTFETSILPYEDCCTIFTPPHPKIRPELEEILEAEAAMPGLAALEAEAAESAERIRIRITDQVEFEG